MLNEQKLNDRMMNLMESGFFGKKILNEGVFAPQVKIKLFQAAYNYIYNQNISVDGEKGVQTNAAIEAVKKALNAYAKTILFDTGKESIKEQSAGVLMDIVAILNEYSTAKFTIEGHTDSTGSEKLNMRLSDARALAVKDYLVKNGVDEFRLSAEGYGETKPIDNSIKPQKGVADMKQQGT